MTLCFKTVLNRKICVNKELVEKTTFIAPSCLNLQVRVPCSVEPPDCSVSFYLNYCSIADTQQYDYGEDLGVTAVALYDYQAGRVYVYMCMSFIEESKCTLDPG